MKQVVEAPVGADGSSLASLPIIYQIGANGNFVDFGMIATGPGIHYTLDPAIPISLAKAYSGSTATLQDDGSYKHTGGTWSYKPEQTDPTQPVDPSKIPATMADINSSNALIATLSTQLAAANLSASSLADALTASNSTITKLKANKPFKLSGTSDASGLINIDLTSYKFTVIPGIAFLPIVATVDASMPASFPELVSISITAVVLRTRKISSILNLGVLPQYAANPNIKIDVVIIPKEPT